MDPGLGITALLGCGLMGMGWRGSWARDPWGPKGSTVSRALPSCAAAAAGVGCGWRTHSRSLGTHPALTVAQAEGQG